MGLKFGLSCDCWLEHPIYDLELSQNGIWVQGVVSIVSILREPGGSCLDLLWPHLRSHAVTYTTLCWLKQSQAHVDSRRIGTSSLNKRNVEESFKTVTVCLLKPPKSLIPLTAFGSGSKSRISSSNPGMDEALWTWFHRFPSVWTSDIRDKLLAPTTFKI